MIGKHWLKVWCHWLKTMKHKVTFCKDTFHNKFMVHITWWKLNYKEKTSKTADCFDAKLAIVNSLKQNYTGDEDSLQRIGWKWICAGDGQGLVTWENELCLLVDNNRWCIRNSKHSNDRHSWKLSRKNKPCTTTRAADGTTKSNTMTMGFQPR